MNIHNILAYESRVVSVADPLGGAYFVEWLTKKDRRWNDKYNKNRRYGWCKKALGWMRE